jgi:hypothetical protein
MRLRKTYETMPTLPGPYTLRRKVERVAWNVWTDSNQEICWFTERPLLLFLLNARADYFP